MIAVENSHRKLPTDSQRFGDNSLARLTHELISRDKGPGVAEGKLKKDAQHDEKKVANYLSDEKEYDKDGLSAYKLFWVAVLASFLGWCMEMVYCRIRHGMWASRQGLVWGPLTPIYGVGAVLLLLLFYRFRHKNPAILFFGGMIGGGIFESLCGYFEIFTFGTRSWNYSQVWGSLLDGTTCIPVMFAWGLIAVLLVKLIYPLMSRFIEWIARERLGKAITTVLFVFVVLDVLLSFAAVAREQARDAGKPATSSLDVFLDKEFPNEKLDKIYANMTKVSKPGAVE